MLQPFLGETLDGDHIKADYSSDAPTLTISVKEAAKPRKLTISRRDAGRQLVATG
jgi:HSP20 family protein